MATCAGTAEPSLMKLYRKNVKKNIKHSQALNTVAQPSKISNDYRSLPHRSNGGFQILFHKIKIVPFESYYTSNGTDFFFTLCVQRSLQSTLNHICQMLSAMREHVCA